MCWVFHCEYVAGGPKARQVCCRETFDMETGSLLAREYFDPGKGPVRLPTPALLECAYAVCFGIPNLILFRKASMLWLCVARARAGAPRDLRPMVVLRGEGVSAQAIKPERHTYRKATGEWKSRLPRQPERHHC